MTSITFRRQTHLICCIVWMLRCPTFHTFLCLLSSILSFQINIYIWYLCEEYVSLKYMAAADVSTRNMFINVNIVGTSMINTQCLHWNFITITAQTFDQRFWFLCKICFSNSSSLQTNFKVRILGINFSWYRLFIFDNRVTSWLFLKANACVLLISTSNYIRMTY